MPGRWDKVTINMDDQTFAYYLSAWLDPYALIKAAGRYDHDRERALASEGLLIFSERITRGEEANFAALAESYLRGFCVPSSLIDFLRVSTGHSAEAWDWLRDLSLSAKVHAYSDANRPHGAPPILIANIEERDVVTDVIKRPILALLDLVTAVATDWRKIAAAGLSVYHKHNMPDPFYAYVDAQVASSYLKLVEPEALPIGSPTFRYRAVTISGIPDDDRMWEVVQQTARLTAASTFDPIRGRGR